jgi:hypothetical protein
MTVSPTAGVAPLTVATAQPQVQQPMSLQAVLAGGANLGGTDPTTNDFGIPAVAGVNTAPTAVAGVNGTTPQATPQTAATGGGGTQAAQGAAAITPELITALQNVISTLNALIGALQAQGGIAGGGGTAPGSGTAPGGEVTGGGAAGGCGMAGCSMDHSGGGAAVEQASEGANGAPKAKAGTKDAKQGATRSGGGGGAGAPATAAAPATAGSVNPSSVKDKASTAGLSSASQKGLEEAHKHGLPLVSGKRSGGAPGSDHPSGNAIDVGTLPIGAASSTHGTADMVAYAEHMRAAGKAGQLNVKYVIHNGQIASATNNWEWRAYTYPGKSQAELEALKQSNRGEYNRLEHFDHVHVSFN